MNQKQVKLWDSEKYKLTYIVVFVNVLDSIKFQGTKELTES